MDVCEKIGCSQDYLTCEKICESFIEEFLAILRKYIHKFGLKSGPEIKYTFSEMIENID